MFKMKKVMEMREKKVVSVPFELSDFERVRQLAKASGLSITAFIRMHALRAAKGE